MKPLFESGVFTLHSGSKTEWRINCEALSDADLETIANIVARTIRFSEVEGIPTGGERLAAVLAEYRGLEPGGYLIVDDVYTTGASMEAARQRAIQRGIKYPVGFVIFDRGEDELPHWIHALWAVSSLGYQL